MIREPANALHVVLITFMVALVLTVLPLPAMITGYKPEWVTLILLYWIMALPQRIGISIAWILGIALDVLRGALLGQHALALTVVAFIVSHLYLRLRMYPFWQQSVVIGFILLVYQVLLLWIYDMTSTVSITWSYWLPSLTGALLWPWLFMVLRNVRRKYNIR